jgi:TonB-dependent SusC/RagA subfamily outer membrane receptor
MKKIYLLLFLVLNSAFSQNFDSNWNQVIEFENEDKIKSADEIVSKIYKNAIDQNNEVQIIKCFFYKSKYIQKLEENAQSKIIDNLQSNIQKVSIPSKAILNLVYAKCLKQYLDKNRYQLNQRTKLDSTATKNFLTWTSENFDNEINQVYNYSIENEAVLKNTTITNYEPIFDFLTLEKFKTQSLYEYLLKENIAYLFSQTFHIYRWDKKNTAYFFGSTEEFQNFKSDTLSNIELKKTVLLYQKLEKNYPSYDNQLERIKIFFNARNISQEFNISYEALNKLQKNKIDDIVLQKILFEKTKLLQLQISKENHPDYNIKTVHILDSIINIKNSSHTYALAVNEKNKITSKSIYVQLQRNIYNNENCRAHINYKNIDNLKISFFKIPQGKFKDYNRYDAKNDSLISTFAKKNIAIISVTQKLINKKDYLDYTTEFLLPQLETGHYLVYFESDNLEDSQIAFAYETITVSNFIVLANAKDNIDYYQILDRKTGLPIENVTVKSKKFNLKTDVNGIVSYKNKKKDFNSYNSYQLELSKGKDTLQIEKGHLNYSNDYEDDEKDEDFKAKVAFYLDRAIYRPGQTVYYKGVVIKNKKNKTSIVPNLLVKITIEDDNSSEIKEFEITTNSFGSFSGEFILPKTGLTGNYRISADEPDDIEKDKAYRNIRDEHPFWDNADFENSEITFKVEEYKRPKFEVTFENVKESYIVDQKVTLNGKAKAFSGSVISDAKVKYTVIRSTYNSNRSFYSQNNVTITNGETKTDASGKFNIDFIAKPDEKSNKSSLPIFSYKIKADVTDINGETRSSESTVKVAYHALTITTSIPKIIESNKINKIIIKSTNLNGEFVATRGSISIFFINGYENKFKERLFGTPEIEGISDENFEKLFPFEKNLKQNLANDLGTLIYNKNIDTNVDKEIILNFIEKYKAGYYKIVFKATDKFDNPLEDKTDFQVKQTDNTLEENKLLTIEQLNKNIKKDGFALLKVSSKIPELFLNYTANYDNKVFLQQNNHLINNQSIIKIPIKKEFEDNVKIGFQCFFENQNFNYPFEIKIEYEKGSMEFETETFRSKIEPGAKEFWSFKLKQSNRSNEAEILASMYDSSLDQFTKRNWEKLLFDNYHSNNVNYKTVIGYEIATSYFKNLNNFIDVKDYLDEFSKLMWFGFDFNNANSNNINIEYKKQITKKASKPKNAKTITGIIKDKMGLPLPGVNITVKGTQRGTASDFDGYYEIEAAEGEQLVFSYIGMRELLIGINAKEINVVLLDDSKSLQEVVVVGYGTQKKKDLTGSISRIIQNEIDYNQNNILNTLQGRVAGVLVTNNSGSSPTIRIRGATTISGNNQALIVVDGVIMTPEQLSSYINDDILDIKVLKESEASALYGAKAVNGVLIITTKKAVQELTQVKSRANLSETAFFFPHLRTDKEGKVSFNFTAPEALTEWKLRLLAHDKNAITGYLQKSVVTQKDLMVAPNFPRFFREKDSIVITTKVSNITSEAKTGIAILQLFDANTAQSVDTKMQNSNAIKNFNIPALGNTIVSWKIYIPEGIQGVQYKVLAKSGNFSDGEENILPVLTNNMLVTESIPIWVRENAKKEYTLENLKNNTSTTLRNHLFTFEYTTNPTWLAIQSLPYLMEYEHECAEQTFSRYYANALATDIINSNPKIASLFDTWKKNGRLDSKLAQNEELKSILLAETPWLMDAKSEDEKKQNLALLFDLDKMKSSLEITFDKLKQKQKSSGGFVWFDGGEESEYITRHILAGFGHLQKMNVKSIPTKNIEKITDKGIPFIDAKFIENHKYRLKNQHDKTKFVWYNSYSDIHYLYTRSFYLKEYPLNKELTGVLPFYLNHIKANWLNYSLFEKGMAALVLSRFKENEVAIKIIESLKETASNNEDWGIYWIENKASWYWYQAPIETQALLIEAFAEVTHDNKSVDAMKVWLLKNKQTKNWPTTKSTTEAVYALLMQGTEWLSVKDNTVIKIGDEKIVSKKMAENQKEAETGYMKLTWKKDEIKKEMATITIENKSKVPSFGGVYWQYFEDLDKIKSNNNGALSISKELYIKKSSSKGDILEKITSNNSLKIGDLVTVRLLISSKEDMEFIHLKDMRASCFEPVNVLSEYKYQGDLSFYQSTKDVATHFFFDQINKGTYVLEYDIRVNNVGEFSNGITTIQSMYAPEFASHTKGIKVITKE